jgi:anti-sigma regulatory factor (Ser/Thr protein kinase)
VTTSGSNCFHSVLELGPLPSAVPCARLHARAIMREWDLTELCEAAELVVSELVTNAVRASEQLAYLPSIWLTLMIEADEVLIAVWDNNPKPMEYTALDEGELPDPTAAGGRGLFLVEHLTSAWGVHYPEDVIGKVVWGRLRRPDPGHLELEKQQPLPKRVPHHECTAQRIRLLDGMAVLRRVRDGLSRLG